GPFARPFGTRVGGGPRRLRYTLAPVRAAARPTDSSARDSQLGGLMAEILTESFCERCGTRYTFQAAAPTKKRLGRFKTLSKGLKNYVLSDETTLEEAFADARSDAEREVSSQQLEAFHQTFNFCMTCRQYTCANCWNEVEGRCLTCAPDLTHDILPQAFPDLEPLAGIGAPSNGHVHDEPANGFDQAI